MGLTRNLAGKTKLDNKERGKVNAGLNDLLSGYHKSIPLDGIINLLSKHDLLLIQEDGTEWSGFFTGSSGKALIEIAFADSGVEGVYPSIENSLLSVTWYKMAVNTYEVVSYLT